MKVSLKSVIAGLALGAIGLSASAVEYGSPASVPVTPAGALPVPVATFDYTSNANGGTFPFPSPYPTFTGIDSITLTVTIKDGDSGPGQFDFNNLSIGLDGIDTGIKLNGFLGGANPIDSSGPITTLDVAGAPQNAAAILAALRPDGQLNLTVTASDLATRAA